MTLTFVTMEQIKVIFFLLGSFFAQENCRIASAITEVQVDAPQKIIEIRQQNLFTTLENEAVFKYTQKQFFIIVKQPQLSKELKNFTLKSLDFVKDGRKLHATIKLSYESTEDLKAMGIFTTKEGALSHINVKDWNMASNDGTLNGKYWNFDSGKPFTFKLI
jgi:hypothetical protein